MGAIVRTMDRDRVPCYLDYNATSPLRKAAREAVLAALAIGGNASSVHAEGRAARAVIERAREQVAALAGAGPADIVFTSGGTEANNLALLGVLETGGCRRALVSVIEHDSVLRAVPEARRIPVSRHGIVDLDALAQMLDEGDRPVLVSVMLANNETGVIQPIAEVARLAHARGAWVHVDAVQAAGRIPMDMRALDADLLTLSGHKIGGPQGVGALVIRDGLPLSPRAHGGGQERGCRAGTENLPGIAGFGAAANEARLELAKQEGIATLRDRLEAAVHEAAPEALIHGEGAPRLANTSCIGLPGVSSEIQLMHLDLAGVSVSAGAACSSGKISPSHVLQAMGVSREEAGCAIRLSLGGGSRDLDVDRFLEAWRPLAARVHAGSARPAGRAIA